MTAQEKFFTRDKANEGVKVPLVTAAGEESEHWFRIRGIDSDNFRIAERDAKRKAIDIAQIGDVQKRAEAIREAEVIVIASLVADWSFDEECTVESVTIFLQHAPQIADMINQYSAVKSNFFKSELDTFIDGSKSKSNSNESQKDQKQDSATT